MTSDRTANLCIYQPRAVSSLGAWQMSHLRLKVYGITAEGQTLSNDIVGKARAFARRELRTLVTTEGEDDGLGFVIIHPGELGLINAEQRICATP